MLPLFIQIAIDRLSTDESLRTPESLNLLIDAYADTYRMPVADADRERAHAEARRRFYNFASRDAAR